MANKYLEKCAGVFTASLGTIGAAQNAMGKDGHKTRNLGIGELAAGAAAGHGAGKVLSKPTSTFLSKIENNLAKVPARKLSRTHMSLAGTAAIGAAAAVGIGAYQAGKLGGKLYNKAKEKISGK